MAITQVSNSLVKQDLTISGGTVDNTVIGSGTPAAGTFTTIAGTLASAVAATTQAASDNSTKVATTAYVTTALANLVDSAPGTLNTLNELAAALGDDANFSTTVTNSIATKLPLAGGTMTGNIAHASNFTIDVGGEITLDADGGVIDFDDGGTNIGRIENASSDFKLEARVQDKDIVLVGNDGGVGVEALKLDMSEAGIATFNSGINIGNRGSATDPTLQSSIDPDTGVYWGGSNILGFTTGGSERLRIVAGKVSIGTTAVASATSASLHVADPGVDVQAVFGDNLASIDDPQIRVIGRDTANSAIRYLFTGLDADANHGFIGYNAGAGAFVNALAFDTSGKVGIGTDSPANSLHIKNGSAGYSWTPDTGDNLMIEANTSVIANIITPNGNNGVLMFSDADARGRGQINYSHTGDDMYIMTAGTTSLHLPSNKYLVAQGASQVRLVLGSTGNANNNTSNWVRGNSTELDFNSGGGVMNWEIGGNKRMTLQAGGSLDLLYGTHINPNSTNNHVYTKLNRTSGHDGHIVFYQSATPQWQFVTDSSHNMGYYGYQSGAGFKFRFEADGDLDIIDGDLKISTVGHGINFSATGDGSGSMQAETLDDYEEGTWTPVLISGGSTNPSGGGALAPSGVYQKVGNRVTVTFYVGRSFTNSPNGTIMVQGLPYTIASGSSSPNYYIPCVTYRITFGNSHIPFIIPTDGGNTFALYAATSGSTWSALTWQSHAASSAGIYISGTFSYVV